MDTNEKKTEPYYPDGGYGWVIVGAIILINVSLITLVPCFGLIFRDEFHEWGITSAQTSFLLHLHSSLYCTFGFFTSPFLKVYGVRPLAFLGSGLMCLGIFLSSFAPSYTYLIFSTSVLIGLGQGIVLPSTYLATYTYFKKRLTIAISLTVTSASLSSIVLPKICDIMLIHVGRKYTVLLLFLISLFSFVGCILLKPVKGKYEETEERCMTEVATAHKIEEENNEEANKILLQQEVKKQNGVYQETTIEKKTFTIWSKLFDIFDLHLLKDVPLVIMIVGLGVSFAAELNIILMIQFILRELSLFERNHVATAISIQSVADIIGRLVVPFLGHHFQISGKVMYASALIFATLARTVLALWPRDHMIVFFTVSLIGLTKGTRAVFQSVILPKYVTLDKIASANGINMLFTGFISLMIGPLIGLVHDKSGTYIYALHAASVLSILCVIMWILEYVFCEKTLSTEKNT